MSNEPDSDPITPTAQSAVPPTEPRGLPLGDEAGVREILLAFRDNFEQFKGDNHARLDSMVAGLKLLDARQSVIESDVRQLRNDVATAKATADGARARADTAHTMAQTASMAAGKTAQDHEAEAEGLMAALASTRGDLQAATAAIGQLRTTDEEIRAMVKEQAQDTAAAAIREVVGKNPKLIAGVGAVLLVLAQVLTQRFLVPPGAPNQGAFPAPTPTVHAVEEHTP